MFMRFSLYPGSETTNPVLAMCNASSKVSFWDFSRLEEYHDFLTNLKSPGETSSPNQRPPFLVPYKHRNRGGVTALCRATRDASPVESASTDSSSNKNAQSSQNNGACQSTKRQPSSRPVPAILGLTPSDSVKSLEIWAKRYSIGDPHGDIIAHKEEVDKGFEFVGRYIAWSNGGEWCVVAGSAGMIGIYERWQK